MPTKPTTIDEYIACFPAATQAYLQKIRETIKKAAPAAEEMISYSIACYKLQGHYLIYFAGFKGHVSVYPAPRGTDAFKELLAGYKGGKGTVQFPLDKPLPVTVLNKIIKFRIQECDIRALSKKKAATS